MRKPPSEALNERSRIVGFNGATLTKLERSVSKGNVYGKTFLFRDGDSIAGFAFSAKGLLNFLMANADTSV